MRRLATYLFLLCLGACHTGHDFPRPTPDSLVLGQSMRAEILRTYGKPTRESSAVLSSAQTEGVTRGEFDMTPVSGSFATLIYLYADRTRMVLMGARSPPPAKVAAFDFWNETLIAYNFVSTFKEESSNFDDSRIAEIRKGQSTKADIAQLFGPPSGRAIYPAVQHQGNEKFVYSYVQVRNSERFAKRLEVLFDANGIVLDYRFVSDTTPIVTAAPSSAAVPIFIPQSHH
jgi:hypothetical protein